MVSRPKQIVTMKIEIFSQWNGKLIMLMMSRKLFFLFSENNKKGNSVFDCFLVRGDKFLRQKLYADILKTSDDGYTFLECLFVLTYIEYKFLKALHNQYDDSEWILMANDMAKVTWASIFDFELNESRLKSNENQPVKKDSLLTTFCFLFFSSWHNRTLYIFN